MHGGAEEPLKFKCAARSYSTGAIASKPYMGNEKIERARSEEL